MLEIALPEFEESQETAFKDGLLLTSKGDIRNCLSNVMHIFNRQTWWKDVFGYNSRANRNVFLKSPPYERLENLPCEINLDTEAPKIVHFIARDLGVSFNLQYIQSAIVSISRIREYDPVLDYFESLKWDGEERLESWLINYVGAKNCDYSRAVGKKYLISAVARTYEPGAKVDTMLVLQGKQGKKKSTVFETLASAEYFTDQLFEINNKDAYLQINGPLICEMAELEAMSNMKSSAVKSFLSTRIDKFRLPYGRSIHDFPRRCVFGGTTNQDAFLKDESGARRFWPVSIGEKIDLDSIKKHRDQLWAEAVVIYKVTKEIRDSGKESYAWWLSPSEEELAASETEKRRQTDPWEEIIRNWLYIEKFEFVTSSQVLTGALSISYDRQDKRSDRRVTAAMKALKWERNRKENSNEIGFVAPEGFYMVKKKKQSEFIF